MLGKLLTLLIILIVVYLLFFKFKNKADKKNENKIENFVECSKCKTFIPLKDSILSGTKHVCKDCIRG